MVDAEGLYDHCVVVLRRYDTSRPTHLPDILSMLIRRSGVPSDSVSVLLCGVRVRPYRSRSRCTQRIAFARYEYEPQ